MESRNQIITPALPRGMRDLLPDQLALRYKIIRILREVFEIYGFQPLETPAAERLDILAGKGGEESDKLSFFVMKRGKEFSRSIEKVISSGLSGNEAARELADMGLRYELTISLARVVAQYGGRLPRPFKRYQIAPVWRAERPQHGRYREFTQCDVDIVGSESPMSDAEVVSLIADVYRRLELPVEIVVNDRRLLSALSGACGNSPDRIRDFCIALDKLDKVGWDGVRNDMAERGLALERFVDLQRAAEERFDLKLGRLGEDTPQLSLFLDSAPILEGVAGFHKLLRNLGVTESARIIFDPTLARGLDYYTGVVFEAKLKDGGVGSLGGGGRYDDLVGAFSKESLPAVGTSFGLDRIADVLTARGGEVSAVGMDVQILCVEWDDETAERVGSLLRLLRESRVSAGVTYHPEAKLGKQLQAASRQGVRYALILDKEQGGERWSVKRLSDGEQRSLVLDEIVDWIRE